MTDPTMLSLSELATALRDRTVSSVEVTQALLERIDVWQPALNAFVAVDAQEAFRAACGC